MELERIGLHVNAPLIDNVEYHYNKGTRVFQIFISSPRAYSEIDLSVLKILHDRFDDAEFVIHGPFWVCLAKPLSVSMVRKTFDYYVKLSHELSKIGEFKLVTHIGGRGDYSKEESANSIYNFCKNWLESTSEDRTILCLENDSGSKNNTKMGFVRLLCKITHMCNNSRIRVCLDTEHAYANGMNINNESLLTQLKPYISVVHLNAIPDNVVQGGHLDRHSKTPLCESKYGWSYLKGVYDVLYDGSIPFIREISSSDMFYSDIAYLNEYGDIIDVEYSEIEGSLNE